MRTNQVQIFEQAYCISSNEREKPTSRARSRKKEGRKDLPGFSVRIEQPCVLRDSPGFYARTMRTGARECTRMRANVCE